MGKGPVGLNGSWGPQARKKALCWCWMGILNCICCCDKCLGCSCLLLPGGQSIWFCNFSCAASGLLHPCSRRELSSKVSRSVCSRSASVLLAFLMGILWLLPCKFGTHFVFFGDSVGSPCLSVGSSSDQCLWLWELLQRRVLSSFMGVQKKQMKQCNICQILSSELLLSVIYSCTCLMLIVFCLARPFFGDNFKKSSRVCWNLASLFSNYNSLWWYLCMIHLYSIGIFHCLCFSQSPSGESHQMERSC